METVASSARLGVGPSLWPLFPSGSRVEVKPLPAEAYQVGDLVVYCGNQKERCLRIFGARQMDAMPWFFLKGDGEVEPEGWVPCYRLEGKVVGINGKCISEFPISLVSRFHFYRSKMQGWLYEICSRPLAYKGATL